MCHLHCSFDSSEGTVISFVVFAQTLRIVFPNPNCLVDSE